MSTDPHLADFLNSPPVVFMELTSNEVVTLGAVNAVIGLLLAIPAGIVFGNMVFAVIVFMFFSICGTLFLGQVVKSNKRNRPEGFFAERIHCWRQKYGLGGSDLITRTGRWTRGRSL